MKQQKQQKEYGKKFFVPILLILAVLPLITNAHIYDNGLSKQLWSSANGQVTDFFLYYKSHFLMILGAIVTVILAYWLCTGENGRLFDKNAWIPLIPASVFALFSLFSAMGAVHAEDAFLGGYEQFEGVFVLLIYVICFIFVYGYVKKEEVVEWLLNGLTAGSCVVSVLGAFQTFGLDWIQSAWARPLVTTELAGRSGFNIKLTFGKGMAYSTLHNPNYVGSYVAVVLPITILLLFTAKKMTFRVLALISTVCQLIMLYGSQSLTGLIGVAGAVIAALIFLLPYAKKHLLVSVGAVVVCIAAVVCVLVAKPGILNRFTGSEGEKTTNTISSIQTEKNSFEIVTGSGKTVVGEFTSTDSIGSFSLKDKKGKTLETATNNNVVTIAEKGYEKIKFSASAVEVDKTTIPCLEIGADGKTWDLVKKDNKLLYYNPQGRLDKLRKVDSIGFENNYDFATRRGYIWSRTFPMLKSTALIGVGADNFVYEFPNNDYVGKVNSEFNAQLITKPHNMYLQIWTQDGMLACLALISLYVMLVIATWKNCMNAEKKTWLQKTAMAIFCGASGYMVVGLANDSSVCVAPLFWILMGLGFAVNHMIKRSKAKEEEQ